MQMWWPTLCRCDGQPYADVMSNLMQMWCPTLCRCDGQPYADVMANLMQMWWPTLCRCDGQPYSRTKYSIPFNSIYGAAAPFGPWPPSEDTSISSLSYAHLLHPCIHRICDVALWMTSSHLVFGFPTALVLRNFPLRTFFWDNFIFHPYNMTCPFCSSNFNIICDTLDICTNYKFHCSIYDVSVPFLLLGHKFFIIFPSLSFVLGSMLQFRNRVHVAVP